MTALTTSLKEVFSPYNGFDSSPHDNQTNPVLRYRALSFKDLVEIAKQDYFGIKETKKIERPFTPEFQAPNIFLPSRTYQSIGLIVLNKAESPKNSREMEKYLDSEYQRMKSIVQEVRAKHGKNPFDPQRFASGRNHLNPHYSCSLSYDIERPQGFERVRIRF